MIDFLLGVPGKLQTLINIWTSARAAYLDAAISSRAPAATALSTVIQSVQRGETEVASPVAYVTISAVNPNKAVLIISSRNPGVDYPTSGRLTDATTVTFFNSSSRCSAFWQVVEFK